MPRTLSLLAVLKKIDAKGIRSLSDPQWNTFLASDTEPNEIQEKIKKLEGYEEKGVAYDATGELIVEDNNAMIERFRQRTGRAKGRESLKVKKSKINVKSFKENFLDKDEEPVVDKLQNPPINFDSDSPPNPNVSKPDVEEEKEETEGLKGIRKVLDDILKVLRLDFKNDRKEARKDQKAAQKQKREDREEELEKKKSGSGVGNAVKGMLKPFSSIWERLLKFLKFTFIGILFNKILKWFIDPENEKKVKAIGKFFKDWWPALSFAALTFLTPFGALVTGAIGFLTAIIPKIVMAIAANPWAALALVGTGLAVWGISKLATAKNKPTTAVDKSVEDVGRQETISALSVEYSEKLVEFQESRNPFRKAFLNEELLEIEKQIGRLEKEMNEESGGSSTSEVTTTREEYTEVAGERFDPDNPTEDQQQAIQFKEMQENSRQRMNEGGLVQHYNDQKSAQNFVQNYNEGGLVQNFNEGGMVDKEFVYSLKKFNTEKVVKGDEITRTKTREKTQGSIQLEDLYANQDQILSQLPEGTTIESIVNGTSDIDAEILYSILQNSDAQAVSNAKERAATMQMMQENNLINSDNTVKGHSFYGGFNKGGGVVSGPGGIDKVPAKLTAGEFVMSKGAVEKFGVGTLASMNAMGGGTNVPTVERGTVHAQGGGYINPLPQGSYKGNEGQSFGDKRSYGDHGGVDITQDMGRGKNLKVPVVAMKDGMVVQSSPGYSYTPKGYASNLSVDHGDGIIATYLHMNPLLKPGDEVKKGDQLGRLVDLANQTHLHLETYKNGVVVNPLELTGNFGRMGILGVGEKMREVVRGAGEKIKSVFNPSTKDSQGIKLSRSQAPKIPVGTPVVTNTSRTITNPPIKSPSQSKQMGDNSNSDVPKFRVVMESSHRSMVISSLGLEDLVRG